MLMASTDKYYGVYLIPPPPLVYSLSQAHTMLGAELNAHTGGKFMVHCTLKGFFKLAPGASPDAFTPALDTIFGQMQQVETEIHPPWVSSNGTGGESVLLWLEKSEAFQGLHDAVWAAVAPHIAPDCLFTPVEPSGLRFPPHITLAQSDLPSEPGLLAQALAVCNYIFENLPSHKFLAAGCAVSGVLLRRLGRCMVGDFAL